MDPRMLDYYERELRYLRELGGEFAKEYPKVAGRLSLDAFECADPYVERLLEGFAFLAARVQLKLDGEFPRFTEHLLETIYPHYLAPTPSMAIVQLKPSDRHGRLTSGFTVPRHTVLKSQLGKGEQTRCTFRTAHEVTLWPIELVQASHSAYVGDLGDIELHSERQVKAALRLRFRTTDGSAFSELKLDSLPLFVHSPRLFELIHAGARAVVVRSPDGQWQETIATGALSSLGFDDEQALLPYSRKSFQGYRLLQEYFALPQRFMFVVLQRLARGVRRCRSNEVEVIVLLDRYDALIESDILPSHLSLHCTPIINLFPRVADRIHLSDAAHEYHLVPDRTRPLDLEVHSVTGVTGVGAGAGRGRTFLPFYSAAASRASDEAGAYYTLHRQPSRVPGRAGGSQFAYVGSEVFLALVDGQEGPFRAGMRQLSVDTLCTNRHLPMYMLLGQGPTDFHLETGAPVQAVRCLLGPTKPRPSNAWGHTSWQLISHLSLNHLSLTDAGEQGATALRAMLQLYGHLADASTRRQIDGVRHVSSSPIVRKLPGQRRATLARGQQVRLECDESAFEGTTVLLLGAVLDRFFARYASINSFTETVLHTTQRGEIMQWPARLGRRPTA